VCAKSAPLISLRLGLVPRRLLRGLGRCGGDALISPKCESCRTDCCTGTKANGVTTGDEHWHLRGPCVEGMAIKEGPGTLPPELSPPKRRSAEIACLTRSNQKLFQMALCIKGWGAGQPRVWAEPYPRSLSANRQPATSPTG
jgi:hypothetical protein